MYSKTNYLLQAICSTESFLGKGPGHHSHLTNTRSVQEVLTIHATSPNISRCYCNSTSSSHRPPLDRFTVHYSGLNSRLGRTSSQDGFRLCQRHFSDCSRISLGWQRRMLYIGWRTCSYSVPVRMPQSRRFEKHCLCQTR